MRTGLPVLENENYKAHRVRANGLNVFMNKTNQHISNTMRTFLIAFTLLGCFILSSSQNASAQEMKVIYPSTGTFTIVDEAGQPDIQRYIDVLTIANLDKFRYENESRVLQFTTGVKFRLNSMRQTYPNNSNMVGMTKNPDRQDPVFSIGKAGKADMLGVTFPVHEKNDAPK